MNWDEQMQEIRSRARLALKRQHIDRLCPMSQRAGKVTVNPLALSRPDEHIKDSLVLAVPDLLDIAIWAWYELGQEKS